MLKRFSPNTRALCFRRGYFTSRVTLDRRLYRFMQFYNFERPLMATTSATRSGSYSTAPWGARRTHAPL